MEDIRAKALEAKKASAILASLSTARKNEALKSIAAALLEDAEAIGEANRLDMERCRAAGSPEPFLDRLKLDEPRLKALAQSVLKVADLDDPIGREEGWNRPNGLSIRKVKVPLGVIAVVYEARPNVTVDSAVLCFKSGNACVLRGSSHAACSNKALISSMQKALKKCGLPEAAVTGIESTDHQSVDELTGLTGIIDCAIPRGGHNLIQRVKETAKIPVIETGVGNCHLYVHADADLKMALNILINGKPQRPGVCNALETLLVDRKAAGPFLRLLDADEKMSMVTLHGCPETCRIIPRAVPAAEEDWDREYLSLDLAVKVVDGLDEAIAHINAHSTGHSEAIITNSLQAARRFQTEVASCAVYVNASTRFTDGGEFGFGAEIGISTQKLHARGPLGLEHLTTCKYLVTGEGQIR